MKITIDTTLKKIIIKEPVTLGELAKYMKGLTGIEDGFDYGDYVIEVPEKVEVHIQQPIEIKPIKPCYPSTPWYSPVVVPSVIPTPNTNPYWITCSTGTANYNPSSNATLNG